MVDVLARMLIVIAGSGATYFANNPVVQETPPVVNVEQVLSGHIDRLNNRAFNPFSHDRVQDFLIQTHPVLYMDTPMELDSKELDCLHKNVFYEAGVEDYIGKIAVAQVTLNRVNAGRWGSSICEVVYKRAQFSWTLKRNLETPKGPLWEASKLAVQGFLNGVRVRKLQNSLFYHATWMEKKPRWVDPKEYVKTIGNHAFFNNDRKA